MSHFKKKKIIINYEKLENIYRYDLILHGLQCQTCLVH